MYRKAFGSPTTTNTNNNFSIHLPAEDKNNKNQEAKKIPNKQNNGDDAEDTTHKEKRLKALNEKINDYVSGFTVHGLTRVLTAPRKESVFWFIALATGLLISIFVVNGLAKKYTRYEVYTEIRSIVTDKNRFPSVSFCEFNMLLDGYFAYCGKPFSSNQKGGDEKKICHLEQIPEPKDVYNDSPDTWSNGLFNINACIQWGLGKSNVSKLVQSRKRLNHSCFTWNYEGDFYDMYSHVSLLFEFKKPVWMKRRPSVIAIPHDSHITEIDLTTSINLNPRRKNQLTMGLTKIHRKEHPYPSKCINGGRGKDLLPGIYSRRTCAETQFYKKIYETCGDTTDYMRPYMRQAYQHENAGSAVTRKYNNQTHTNYTAVSKCISNMISKMDNNQLRGSCPFPCNELEIATFATHAEMDEDFETIVSSNDTKYYYQVELQLLNVDSYKIMEEKELYTWDQMACEIGGFLGLVMGASMLSMIEIIACSWFYAVKRAKFGKKHETHLLED